MYVYKYIYIVYYVCIYVYRAYPLLSGGLPSSFYIATRSSKKIIGSAPCASPAAPGDMASPSAAMWIEAPSRTCALGPKLDDLNGFTARNYGNIRYGDTMEIYSKGIYPRIYQQHDLGLFQSRSISPVIIFRQSTLTMRNGVGPRGLEGGFHKDFAGGTKVWLVWYCSIL